MKTVLITGASSGIGLATAIGAARSGWTVVAGVRDPAGCTGLRAAADAAGVSVDVRRLDVPDQGSIDACLAGTIERHGRLDALVNNAGIAQNGATVEFCDLDTIRTLFEVNFFGVVAMTKAALPHLRASSGRLVAIGSTRGVIGQPFNEAYSAAKFAVEGFLESLAPVAAEVGVAVSIIEPGAVVGTRYGSNLGPDFTREYLLSGTGPYVPLYHAYFEWGAREALVGSQTADEVAEAVVDCLEIAEPAFRVPTSAWAAAYLQRKLHDADGSAVQRLTRPWVAPAQPPS
jgi:NAD(P)-dependent dehydrogenase (short-subunit alcohol dehydrogenase family)